MQSGENSNFAFGYTITTGKISYVQLGITRSQHDIAANISKKKFHPTTEILTFASGIWETIFPETSILASNII
jgi:hypothetical protein